MNATGAVACLAPVDSPEVETPPHILIVDDEAFIRNAFQLYFESLGYRVSVADGGEAALNVFQSSPTAVDVVLLDLIMPGIPGIKLLQKIKELDDSIEVIIATGCGTMNSAIEALRHGAYDYITKPILNFDEDLLRVVRGAIGTRTNRLKAAFGPEGAETSASVVEEFYRSLEALARRVATDPGTALDTVGRFLEKELAVLAGVALRVGTEDVSCFARWGRALEMSEAALQSDARVWLETIEVHRGWKVIRPSDRGFGLLESCSCNATLEALRIPLEIFSSPGSPDSANLVLFREHGGSRAHAPPDVTLLEVVLSRAVVRSL